MTPFESLRDYELFVYSLQEQFPSVRRSTLVLAQRGRLFAELTGELSFDDGYRLEIYERLAWESESISIEGYSYEAWHNAEKIYWYDSQPHPNIPELASTDPHHKHIPPDIKHNRIPAPTLSFTSPNLSFLIGEVEMLISSGSESE
ncbi:MAG: hypothetical protein HZB17_14360 [Chloroflexi bacterium]|nr:hypothetical protein [Chloroflexota bacterium]